LQQELLDLFGCHTHLSAVSESCRFADQKGFIDRGESAQLMARIVLGVLERASSMKFLQALRGVSGPVA